MHKLEQMLDSLEVAEMIQKNHKDLIRDIKRYIKQIDEINEKNIGERKIAPSDFFIESTYKTEQNKKMPCYRITKKGCELIAHKLTGQKGTEFTARYINRFHEMENMLSETARPEVSTEQMEKLLGFMEKQQQFMEDQEKFNQMVIKKLESPKRIQTHQDEYPEYMTAAYKKEIIVLLDMADGDLLFLKQIYTIIKAHARRLEKIGRYANC